ncbi:MAG: hypothetical protein JRD93_04065 [Deltaproteobacteria bacterium]|nr:hypothetical protein [Deltaproteobacteria bacterium]
MNGSTLETIEKEAASLSVDDHIELIEALVHQLRKKSVLVQQKLDWKELYGLGKDLWQKEDAQNHVNKLREDRI